MGGEFADIFQNTLSSQSDFGKRSQMVRPMISDFGKRSQIFGRISVISCPNGVSLDIKILEFADEGNAFSLEKWSFLKTSRP